MVTGVVLAKLDDLTEIQRAVRDRFQQGGSVTAVLLVLLALAAVVFGVYYLTRRQRKENQVVRRADPQKLFSDLVHKLGLTPPQRRLLGTVAKDLQLKQPAVILLCPALFDRHLQEWQAGHRAGATGTGKPSQSELAAQTCAVLFPPN